MQIPLGDGGAENLFGFFSQCYEKTSLIVTTNLPFSEWPQVFGDERLTGALLDRLTHRVHILEINGDSYRLKDSLRSREANVSGGSGGNRSSKRKKKTANGVLEESDTENAVSDALDEKGGETE